MRDVPVIEHGAQVFAGSVDKCLLVGVSTGAFADMSFCQSGPPVNNSPSHHTVPASSASRSVADMDGSILR